MTTRLDGIYNFVTKSGIGPRLLYVFNAVGVG